MSIYLGLSGRMGWVRFFFFFGPFHLPSIRTLNSFMRYRGAHRNHARARTAIQTGGCLVGWTGCAIYTNRCRMFDYLARRIRERESDLTGCVALINHLEGLGGNIYVSK